MRPPDKNDVNLPAEGRREEQRLDRPAGAAVPRAGEKRPPSEQLPSTTQEDLIIWGRVEDGCPPLFRAIGLLLL